MIDILSVAVGVFTGGCMGFIAGKLSCTGEIDSLYYHTRILRLQLENSEEELRAAQDECLNLTLKITKSKPKRDKHGRFIPKNEGEV
jgi:hypothetical protein